MKILLSAYSCDPSKGSEPGVGWNWAVNIARAGHEVWVLTRSVAREHIERELRRLSLPNLHFEYVDIRFRYYLPVVGIYPHYYLWQVAAYRRAKVLHSEIGFDRAHHITMGVFRHPSLTAWLGIPFVFGPVGGGEYSPVPLRKSLPFGPRLRETLRDLVNSVFVYDPLLRAMFRRTETILCKTRETAERIPSPFQHKCRVQMEIGHAVTDRRRPQPSKHQGLNALFVGRLLGWKGIHLAIAALALVPEDAEVNLTIVGNGSEGNWLRQVAAKYRVEDRIRWIPWLPHEEVLKMYGDFDVLLFPSLHDSSSNVVLEALVRGLPVVCLDLGGPGVIVDDGCGRVISTKDASEEQVIQTLARELVGLARDPSLRQQLSAGAITRAEQFRWEEVVGSIYPVQDSVLRLYT